MRYFFDTEFIEDGHTIDLISIGIVCNDGREYYAINFDCNWDKASPWVKDNVLSQLPPKPLPGLGKDVIEAMRQGYRNRSEIADEVAIFCGCQQLEMQITRLAENSRATFYALPAGVETPEFWAYYADYDWVVFCQLFGAMIDLPKGFPMYCRDVKQECDRLGNPRIPRQETKEHHALEDARWTKKAWEFLIDLNIKEV